MNIKKSIYFAIVFFFTIFYLKTSCLADDYSEFYDPNFSLPVSSNTSSTPTINARHAIVLDRESKQVLFGKNEQETCKMASTTKIMTAIVVIENCKDLSQTVTISKKAARYWWF